MTWKTPVTLLVLFGVLLAAAYYGWATVVSSGTPDKKTTPTTPTCATTKVGKGQRLLAKNVVVNVYNAGSVDGLAGRTLTTLKARGFRGGVASNAPADINAPNVMILTRDRTAPQVQLVARQFLGPIAYGRPRPLAPGVVVIVGDNLAGFRKQVVHALVVHTPVRACATTTK